MATAKSEKFSQATTSVLFPEAKFDYFDLDELLSDEEKKLRQRIRQFAEKDIAPIIVPVCLLCHKICENFDFEACFFLIVLGKSRVSV